MTFQEWVEAGLKNGWLEFDPPLHINHGDTFLWTSKNGEEAEVEL